MPMTGVLKDYALSKVEHLEHFFDNVQKVDVVVQPEGAAYGAELVVHAPPHTVLVSHAGAKTATAALDLVIDMMERRLTKHKEKLRLKATKARGGRRGAKAAEPEEDWI